MFVCTAPFVWNFVKLHKSQQNLCWGQAGARYLYSGVQTLNMCTQSIHSCSAWSKHILPTPKTLRHSSPVTASESHICLLISMHVEFNKFILNILFIIYWESNRCSIDVQRSYIIISLKTTSSYYWYCKFVGWCNDCG